MPSMPDVTWDTPLSSDFDATSAAEQLSTAVSPFAVIEALFSDGGTVVDAEMVHWLLARESHPLDLGRFARQVGIRSADLGRAARGLPEWHDIAVGYLSERPPVSMPEKSPDFDGRVRQSIDISDPQSRDLAERAWDVIRQANEPPQLFRFGDTMSWIVAARADLPVIKPLTKEVFEGYLHHRTVEWTKPTSQPNPTSWQPSMVEVEPPPRVLKDMWANPQPPLPILTGVRSAPVFAPSGRLAVDPGYDPESRMFVWPQNLDLPFVPMNPSATDIAKARNIIEYELLGDFPFQDDASRAHAIAAMLHPFVRPMIVGPTPIHLVDKPTAGTGAGLLVEALMFPALGLSPELTTVGKLEDEWRFRMMAFLRRGPMVVVLDNINTVLSSPALAAMVTAPDAYTDRLIKTSDTITVPIRNLWVATGNNVQVSHEMARRCVLIRMDAKLEHPESGREFRHDPLMDWVRAHRGELVWAALVLVQAWVAKGRPRGTKSKGTFESWAKTISGIFEVCGMPGFLENKDELEAYSDSEEETWTAIIEAWWSTHGDKPVGSGDLLSIAVQHLSELGEAGQSRSTKWGVMLKSKRDTIISGKRIVSAGKNQGAAQWKLIYVNQERTSSEPRRSPQEETPSSQAGT